MLKGTMHTAAATCPPCGAHLDLLESAAGVHQRNHGILPAYIEIEKSSSNKQ